MSKKEVGSFKEPSVVKKMFDSISADYDKLNDIMSFRLHKKIKEEAFLPSPLEGEGNFSSRDTSGRKMGEGYKILDLCTGTGDIAAILKEKFPKAKIIGLDFSQNMLEIARKKHPDIEFLQGDCIQLPFEDESFDVCTISFGLRNIDFVLQEENKSHVMLNLFQHRKIERSCGRPCGPETSSGRRKYINQSHENLEKAVSEIYRVLKKDGVFINLDLGKPKPIFNLFLKPYMYIWVAILGKIFHGDETPYKYLAQSNETFPAPAELMKIYKKIGFKEVKNKNYLFGQISSQFSVK